MTPLCFFIVFFIFIADKTTFLINFFTADTLQISLIQNYLLENSLVLNKLFNYPINILTIVLIIYLFLTLVVAVKITNIFEGPLRPKS